MRARRSAAGLVQRAQIVLLAARGRSNAAIARALGCRESTVRKWKERFRSRPKLASLNDAGRTGRPPSVLDIPRSSQAPRGLSMLAQWRPNFEPTTWMKRISPTCSRLTTVSATYAFAVGQTS